MDRWKRDISSENNYVPNIQKMFLTKGKLSSMVSLNFVPRYAFKPCNFLHVVLHLYLGLFNYDSHNTELNLSYHMPHKQKKIINSSSYEIKRVLSKWKDPLLPYNSSFYFHKLAAVNIFSTLNRKKTPNEKLIPPSWRIHYHSASSLSPHQKDYQSTTG